MFTNQYQPIATTRSVDANSTQPSQATFNLVFGVDVLSQIIPYLDLMSLRSLSQVSKDFRQHIRTIALVHPKSHPTLLILREIEALRTLRAHIDQVTSEIEYLAEIKKKRGMFDISSSDLAFIGIVLASAVLDNVGALISTEYRDRYKDPLKLKWCSHELWAPRNFKHPLEANSWQKLMADLKSVADAIQLFEHSVKGFKFFYSIYDKGDEFKTKVTALNSNGIPKTKEEAIQCLEIFTSINRVLNRSIRFYWRNNTDLCLQYAKAPLGLFDNRLFINKKIEEPQDSLAISMLKKFKLR